MIVFFGFAIAVLPGEKSLPSHSSNMSIKIVACYFFITVLSFFCEIFKFREGRNHSGTRFIAFLRNMDIVDISYNLDHPPGK